jgi:hypothetical protein
MNGLPKTQRDHKSHYTKTIKDYLSHQSPKTIKDFLSHQSPKTRKVEFQRPQ